MIHWLVHSPPRQPVADFLTPAEMAVYRSLRSEKRRQDWLLGRWTVKQLIQQVSQKRSGEPIACEQVSVIAGEDGAPTAWRQTAAGDRPLAITISISHSRETAACALIEQPHWPLGIDLEWIEPRSAGFTTDYFTETERKILARSKPPAVAAHTTAIWSAKEAALKAVHQGLKLDTRSVSCAIPSFAEPPALWTPFTITWDREHLKKPLPALMGWWRTAGNFVLTLAAGAAGKEAVSSDAYAARHLIEN